MNPNTTVNPPFFPSVMYKDMENRREQENSTNLQSSSHVTDDSQKNLFDGVYIVKLLMLNVFWLITIFVYQ
jgi:hypothetical protein